MSMITVASLTCGGCENEFPISTMSKPKSVTCPFCSRNMAEDMINEFFNAIQYVAEVNGNFIKYHDEYDNNLFSLSVKQKEVKLQIDDIQQER